MANELDGAQKSEGPKMATDAWCTGSGGSQTKKTNGESIDVAPTTDGPIWQWNSGRSASSVTGHDSDIERVQVQQRAVQKANAFHGCSQASIGGKLKPAFR